MKKMFSFAFLVFLFTQMSAQGNAAEDICPILIGEAFPNAEVTSADGNRDYVRDLLQRKPAIFIVYRGGWCPYCNRHFAALGQIEGELREMGYQIFALSPDLPENLQATIEKNHLNYTLLSDPKLQLIDALGLSFQVDDKTLERYQNYGIDLEEASGEDHHRLPVPAVFVIDEENTVRFHFINPNYKVRADPDLILAAARAALEN